VTTAVKQTILKYKQLHVNDALKWEVCKNEIKQVSINYSKRKSRERYNRLQHLETKSKLLLSESIIKETKLIEFEINIKEIYDAKSMARKLEQQFNI